MSLEIDGALQKEKLSNETINQLFSRLKPEDIEQFYMAYQLWSQQQQIEQQKQQILALQQQIAENAVQMEQVQPSAIALASLAQLQAYGVADTDLLDQMLERGETWLDHSIQLLERCEQLDLIGDDYTQWCEHALEGAYDWIDSITDPEAKEAEAEVLPQPEEVMTDGVEITEALLLQKLMSEEDEDASKHEKTSQPRITQPLSMHDELTGDDDETQIVSIVKPSARITQPLPLQEDEPPTVADDRTQLVPAVKSPRRITQPLSERSETEDDDKTQVIAAIKLSRRITQPLPPEDEQPASDETILTSFQQSAAATEDQNTPQIVNDVETKDIEQAESETALLAPDDDAQTSNSQQSPEISTTSDEIGAEDDTAALHAIASPTETSQAAGEVAQEATQQEQGLAGAAHVDQDQTHAKDGTEAGYTTDRPLQNIPASKKVAPKKKRGFLSWLLTRILRRSSF